MNHSSHGQHTASLTIPGTGGQFATQIIYLATSDPDALPGKGDFDSISELQVHVESLPAAATIEVDLLSPDGDAATAADWLTAVDVYNATGLQSILALAAWKGVRIRGKSGGTGGTSVVHVSWW